jgi:hypothetical protein
MGLKEQKRAAEKQFLGSSAKVSKISMLNQIKCFFYEFSKQRRSYRETIFREFFKALYSNYVHWVKFLFH